MTPQLEHHHPAAPGASSIPIVYRISHTQSTIVYDVQLGRCTILVDLVGGVAVEFVRASWVTQKALDGYTARAPSPRCSTSIEHPDRAPYIPCIEYDRVRCRAWSMHDTCGPCAGCCPSCRARASIPAHSGSSGWRHSSSTIPWLLHKHRAF
jgi:hypothetical protein